MKEIILACLAGFGLTGCVGTPMTQADPNAVLAKYGYQQQVPPVATHGPGSLVWKRRIPLPDERYASLGYICEPQFTVDPGPPITSPTEKTDIGRELSASFDITGPQLANVSIGAAAGVVDKVTLTLNNVEVQEYPLQILERIKSTLGPECRKILKEQIRKQNAYQVLSVVKADVAYAVQFKAGVSVSAKAQALTAIGAKLGLGGGKTEGTVGTGLFYGIDLQPQSSL